MKLPYHIGRLMRRISILILTTVPYLIIRSKSYRKISKYR